MSAEVKTINIDEAKKESQKMKFAIGHFISDFKVGKPNEIGAFDKGDCLEARFFSKDKEIHVFRENDELICIESKDGGTFYDTEYEMENRFRLAGKYVVVRTYLDIDEDGQCIVSGTRLVEIKEA